MRKKKEAQQMETGKKQEKKKKRKKKKALPHVHHVSEGVNSVTALTTHAITLKEGWT